MDINYKLVGLFFGIVATSLLSFKSMSYAAPTKTQYDIEARLDIEKNELMGRVAVGFQNTSGKNSKEIYLINYTNGFREKNERLDDVTFERVYPKDFNPGYTDVKNCEISGKGGVKQNLSLEYKLEDKKFKNIVAVAKLPDGLQDKGEIKITCDYVVKIPEKFGTFGRWRGAYFLNDVFYPRLSFSPPAEDGFFEDAFGPAEYFIKLTLPKNLDVLIGNKFYEKTSDLKNDKTQTTISYFARQHFPSIVVGKNLIKNTYNIDDIIFHHYQFQKDNEGCKKLEVALNNIVSFIKLERISILNKEIYLVDCPLRNELVVHTDGVLFVSDKLLRIFSYIRYLHETQLLRGILQELFRPNIEKIETAGDHLWVSEALAWFYTEKYQTYLEQTKNKVRNAQDIYLLKIFSFIPAVQEALLAPQYPYSYAYFDKIYHVDSFGDDVHSQIKKIPSGRIVAEKIKDMYPLDIYNKMFVEYQSSLEKGNKRFIEIAASSNGNKIRDIINDASGEFKKQNIFIKDISKKKEDGKWQTKIDVVRDNDGSDHSKVEILAVECGGQRHYLSWTGRGEAYTFNLETDRKVKVVEIDPHHRIFESKLSDNRNPEKYMLIVPGFNISFSIFHGELDAFVMLELRRMYNPVNTFNFYAAGDPARYDVSVGYGRWLGKLVDALRLSHFFNADFNFSYLKEGFIKKDVEDNSGGTSTVDIPNDSGITNTITLSYSFANMLSYRNPQEGFSAGIFGEFGHKYLGSDYDFYKFQVSGTKLIQIINEHVIAVEGRLGYSGHDVPEQKQFSLGGVYNIRGIPQGYSEYIGRYRLLFGGEYRHMIVNNLDINILNVVRVQKIQGAFFMDTGGVADRVEDQRLQKADPTYSYDKSFGEIFDVRGFSSDFGYSARLIFDAFGVRSTLFRVDVAKKIDDFMKESVQLYFTFDQAF